MERVLEFETMTTKQKTRQDKMRQVALFATIYKI